MRLKLAKARRACVYSASHMEKHSYSRTVIRTVLYTTELGKMLLVVICLWTAFMYMYMYMRR